MCVSYVHVLRVLTVQYVFPVLDAKMLSDCNVCVVCVMYCVCIGFT